MPIARVLVAVERTLYRDLLQQHIEANPLLEVVDFTSRNSATLLMAGQLLADIVLLSSGAEGTIPGICSHLLYEYPEMAVVVVSPTGDHATLYRQTMTAEQFGGLGQPNLQRLFNDVCREKVE